MVSGPLLFAHQGEDFHDVYMYHSTVDALKYATFTHFGISYSVNKTCQFMLSPKIAHWQHVKHILRYPKGALSHGLWLRRTNNLSLVYFVDAD